VPQFGPDVKTVTLIKREFMEAAFVRHRFVAQFEGVNILIPKGITQAIVKFSIRLSDGVRKEQIKRVEIQVIGE